MKCYLCGKNNPEIIRTKLRHDISRNVLICKDCGIVYLEPKKTDLKEFYEEDYRKLYTPVIGKKLSSRDTFEIYLPYQRARIDEIKHILNPKMKVLDIGCSSGHFLYTVKNHVQECIGIEFNRDDAKFVNEELGIKTYTVPIENTDMPFEYFDLITLYETLEHIDDPITFLATIYKYLKPEGFLVIEAPNIQDALISIYNIEGYADFWYKEPHVFYYSPKTLTMMLQKCGYSGTIKTLQGYSFLNHINWILTGQPQKSVDIGMSKPKLISSESINPKIKSEFNSWIQKIDEEYKKLLTKHDLGEILLFIGQKTKK